MKILIINQFDLKQKPFKDKDCITHYSITSLDRVNIHRADFIFYVEEKSSFEPRYFKIVKHRNNEIYEHFREVLNRLIDRHYFLFEMSKMFNQKLMHYELKDFIKDEFNECYGKDVEFLEAKDFRETL